MAAAPNSINPSTYLADLLAEASPDMMRKLMQDFINSLLSAQADAQCGAEYNSRSTHRVNRRNGYRSRALDTRVGTLDIAIPKLRQGSLNPTPEPFYYPSRA